MLVEMHNAICLIIKMLLVVAVGKIFFVKILNQAVFMFSNMKKICNFKLSFSLAVSHKPYCLTKYMP